MLIERKHLGELLLRNKILSAHKIISGTRKIQTRDSMSILVDFGVTVVPW